MSKTKIVTIVGARPQFIKAAVVSRALKQFEATAEEKIIHTGQHFDANMSDIFFEELDIPKPHFHLGVGGGTHGQNTGRMMEKIEEVLLTEKPSVVLVYGDTDSTLAGAVAAVKLHIPVAHVEAGLRSFNKKMPEEINRILTDHAADILFTPTSAATNHALSEGLAKEKIQQVGDVMYDAALYYAAKPESSNNILQRLSLTAKQFILTTLHRAENVDDKNRLQQIINGLAKSSMPVILPMHPRTKKRLQEFGLALPANIHIIEPTGYLDMIMMEKHAAVIATDSGGVQKEAYFHKTPCVTMRDETEWVELVEAGANILTGADENKIEAAIKRSLDTSTDIFDKPLYGNGDAGLLIAKAII
jgi:UDP-GlcNAc3NAcA epimerase